MYSFLTGFTVGLGLIVAIGAQNAWVLSMSIRRQHPWIIAPICIVIDALLMAVGISTLDWVQQKIPALVPWLTLLGIGLLTYLILQCLWRVYKGDGGLEADENIKPAAKLYVAAQAVLISLLNPHVYLDTVILMGSVGINQPLPWVFWLGGAVASLIWFSSLVLLAKPLRIWLKSPTRWRIFDLVLAFLLFLVALGLINHLDFSHLFG